MAPCHRQAHLLEQGALLQPCLKHRCCCVLLLLLAALAISDAAEAFGK